MTRLEADLGGGAAIRPYRLEDAEPLWALVDAERERVGRWLAWVRLIRSLEDERRWLEHTTVSDAEENHAIVVDGDVAGGIGLILDPLDANLEIGYWLGSRFEGRGLVTSACRLVLSHAFAEHQAHRVTIAAAVGNTRSRAVAERLGFVLDGVARESTRTDDGFSDLAIYGILDREWNAA
jgi:ribosomal-protein-serine acetyltransferase